MLKILIRGSGDIGSAVAWHLFQTGYSPVLHDEPHPSATRRKMAFSDAIFDGRAELEGLSAQRLDDMQKLEPLLATRTCVPVLTCDFISLLQSYQPQVLIDARMRKHVQPENQLQLAALTIGLGPNFNAGENVQIAIETGRGENLGQVIRQGSTQALQGEPIELGGHARERYLYAPASGLFQSDCQIGENVTQGQIIAHLNGSPLPAPLTGVLRGLTRSGIQVSARTKIIEIDPRGPAAQISGIAMRPARIAQGVLNAIATSTNIPQKP